MSSQAMKRRGGTLNAYDYVQEADHKRLHIYNSNYVTVWERQNYRDNKKTRGCQG